MNKEELEQVILIIWTFVNTILDLIRFMIFDQSDYIATNAIILTLATIISAFIYYMIGWFILTVINYIHNKIKR